MMRRAHLYLLLATIGCGAPGPITPDAATADAATDAATDAPLADSAACTARPGDLPGARSVSAGGLLPNLTFTTATGTATLVDHHVPCAPQAQLLVIRSLAAWSGHSLWHVAHTARLLAHPQRARLHFLDLLVAGADALRARTVDLADFATHYDTAPDALAIDPTEQFGVLALSGIRLPVVVLVDLRTLAVVRVLFAPHEGQIERAIDVALASLDGVAPPAPTVATVHDARFTDDEWNLIQGMAYPTTLPRDPSNAHASDPAAAALGAALFADRAMSPASVACATCHQQALGFGDARALGHGVADVTRNTPTIYASAFVRWPFWDGRVDSLWAQALGPAENAREMGSSRLFIAHRVATSRASEYAAVFGALPDLSDASRFPASGAPGDAAWSAMSVPDQNVVTRIFTNVGKAIEAFERTIAPPHSRFDDYLAGNLDALTTTERDGLREYMLEGCADCHYGPALSNSAFHAIGMPGFGQGSTLDVGRSGVLATLTGSPFRRQGAYSDAPSTTDPLAGVTMLDASTLGAFRTPTLRGIASTGPYGHAGTFATLREVVAHYAQIRIPPATPDPRVAGGIDPHVLGFDNVMQRVDPLTAFLMTL